MNVVGAKAGFYSGSRYRKSPFFEATRRAGCKSYGIYNHMYIPDYYDDPVEEYRSLTNDVTLWDVSVERIVEITGAGRVRLYQQADVARPDEVRGGTGQIRADHRRRRRHRKRAGALAFGREPMVAGALGFRRRPVGARLCRGLGTGREGPRARGLSDPGTGPEVEGRDGGPLRGCGPEHSLLLDHGDRPRRYSGGHQPHGLDRRGGIRNLPPRPRAAAKSCGTGSWMWARRTASDRSRRRRSAASRPGSSATAPT